MDDIARQMRTQILLILMGFFSSWLKADTYKEQRTGIEFPANIAEYKRVEVIPYQAETGKGGVAIEYRSPNAEVTV